MDRIRVASERCINAIPVTAAQLNALDGARRFNIVSGGKESGKTTLCLELIYQAIEKGFEKVVYIAPFEEMLLEAIRRCCVSLREIAEPRKKKTEIRLITGMRISFFSLDKTADVFERANRILIDDAQYVDDLENLANKLSEGHEGDLWIFGKPDGAARPFGRLYLKTASNPNWHRAILPTRANPKARIPQGEEEAYRQEYGGEVLSIPSFLSLIPKDESFVQWCERLGKEGMKVDGIPFALGDRPAMRWIYAQLPSSIEEAYDRTIVLMKAAQVGFTVMEILYTIYCAMKFQSCKIGMYVPDMTLARIKSDKRFLKIIRTIPAAYNLMLAANRGKEGNVHVRAVGEALFYFLWTTGKVSTESIPLDIVSYDEVQEMEIPDIEKTKERMSASSVRFSLLGSTAKWPDRDIHYFYKLGTRHQFWTQCEKCGVEQVLDEEFPDCIQFVEGDYHYVCKGCKGIIADAQRGQWRPMNPDAEIKSIHFSQILSPTISPREMILAYFTADDMQNFYNRKLGKPYLNPSQIPVNFEMLNACVEMGLSLGVTWKASGAGTYMGIDQMGAFNVAILCERLPSGHMAVIHAEAIYSDDPFARCDELMECYGVEICVVETLPNYNDAKRFCGRFPGRVFLANYSDIKDEMMRWGDSALSAMDVKTAREDRDRYTVTIDQYKCMQVAMTRIQKKICVFPNPAELTQEIREKGVARNVRILKDMVFEHLTHTALIAEKDPEEKKYRRRVVKVGIDPHFSYAYMLMNIAWARSHGNTLFLNPQTVERAKPMKVVETMKGLPPNVLAALNDPRGEVCGACEFCKNGRCTERNLLVRDGDAACYSFIVSIHAHEGD